MNLLISNSRASYYNGGTEVVSLHQAASLARLGHEITYLVRLVPEQTEYFRDFEYKIRKEKLPIEVGKIAVDAPFGDGVSWDKWNQEAAAFGEAAQDRYEDALNNGAELSVTHMSADALYLPAIAPQVLHLHGSPISQDALIDASMQHPDHAVAHSSSIKSWWSSRYPDVPMSLFHNGVPVETFFHPVDAERPIDILYTGRFLAHKGITDVLMAAEPTQRIVIAGTGPLLPEILQIIKDRGLDASVAERPSNEEMVRLYRSAKIFACPSRGKEGVLTTMLEAAAAGCCIVTTNGSGMVDLAINKQNSLLIEPGDVEALHNSFTSLLNDEDNRHSLAQAMQDTIIKEWSWEQKAGQLEDIYENAR